SLPSCRYSHFFLSSPLFLFFFTATAPTEIYTLSLHDALPIAAQLRPERCTGRLGHAVGAGARAAQGALCPGCICRRGGADRFQWLAVALRSAAGGPGTAALAPSGRMGRGAAGAGLAGGGGGSDPCCHGTAADSPQGLDATAGQAGRRSRMGSVAVPPGRSHPAAGRCALAGAGPVAGEGGIGGYCLPGCRCTWLGGSGVAGDRCPVAGFVPGMRAPLVRPGRTGGDPVSRRAVLQPASQSVAQVDGADAQRRGASAAALAGAALLGGWQ